MHDELWAGVGLKLEYAQFHLRKMTDALQPPRSATSAAMQSSNTIIGTDWQASFFAHFDAFLSAMRSVPWIIEACFGADTHPNLKDWWNNDLKPEERRRRRKFGRAFQKAKAHKDFLKLRLVKARNSSVHHAGYAPVDVRVNGLFGVVHIGSPIKRVPDAEARGIPPGAPADWPVGHQPIAPVGPPRWGDFKLGKTWPLHAECMACLDGAQKVIAEAQAIDATEHGSARLTLPRAR